MPSRRRRNRHSPGQTFQTPYGVLPRWETRRLLAEAQNWRCCYCAVVMTDGARLRGVVQPGTDASIEHLLQRARGGADEWSNLVAACLRCNAMRGVITPLRFFQMMSCAAWAWLAEEVAPKKAVPVVAPRPRDRHRWPPLVALPEDAALPAESDELNL